MIPPVPQVDFSFGNVVDQVPDSGPAFPQSWDVVSLSIAHIVMT